MTDERILTEARIIAERLSDLESIRFHYKAVLRLGFDTCYELSSMVLQADRDGRIKTTPARYYNGCVMKELDERKLLDSNN